ncbi:MAG: hypothetical protein VKK04_20860 [Synechococcales bacterium]|nr:hypothetical protein [Synechococcales bacterium]
MALPVAVGSNDSSALWRSLSRQSYKWSDTARLFEQNPITWEL